jgi:hypothetical protein
VADQRHVLEPAAGRRLDAGRLRLLRLDGEVDEQAGAERLDAVERRRDEGGGRARVVVARAVQVLGPDPDDHARAAPLGEALVACHVGGHGKLDVAELHDHVAVPRLERRLREIHGRRPDEARDEEVLGPVVDLRGRADLLQDAVPQHRDPVAHRHRLDLVVGDVDRRDAEPLLQRLDLTAHLHAQLRVEVRERLVHQERLRLADDRAAHRDPLALAAGELLRPPVEQVLEPEQRRRLAHASPLLVPRRACEAQAEPDVLRHGHVRVERVALEDHRHVAVALEHVVHPLAVDRQRPVADVLEPRDHPQRRRLAAARRADEDEQLRLADLERQLLHRLEPVRIALRQPVEDDRRHGYPFSAPAMRPRMK